MTTTTGIEGDNIRVSVASAQKALEHLERSLDAGGFREGRKAYQQMGQTLLAQRLVASKAGPELDGPFAALGTVAGRVKEILTPYAEVMSTLSLIAHVDAHAVEAATSGVAPEAAVAEPHPSLVLGTLRTTGPMTVSDLHEELELSPAHVRAALRDLRASSSVGVRTVRGTNVYAARV